MQQTTRAQGLRTVAEAWSTQGVATATHLAKSMFPWSASQDQRTVITPQRSLQIFLRDQFTDRYSGSQLAYPGALLALGLLLPEAFPIHQTWKVSQSHEIFWELWPVIDHVVPVTRHGTHSDDNLVTTSSTNNTAKGAALLSELGWTLRPPPAEPLAWDGMLSWFGQAIRQHPQLTQHSQLRRWHQAAASLKLL